MTSSEATVAIVIPTCQRASSVLPTIVSVLGQDLHGSMELIVSDNGSTDRTGAALAGSHC